MKLKVLEKEIVPERVFCIGMNYADHVKELGNALPESPVIFMKPATCLVPAGEKVTFPTHGEDLHYEAELVVLIGREGRPNSEKEARDYMGGLSLGLDLTLRDVQTRLRKKGHPWEVAKAFDGSAPVGRFIPFHESIDLARLTFRCLVNNELRQEGNTADMIFPVERLIYEISKIWSLKEGDLIYTGTPSGVGSLKEGDVINVEGEMFGTFSWAMG